MSITTLIYFQTLSLVASAPSRVSEDECSPLHFRYSATNTWRVGLGASDVVAVIVPVSVFVVCFPYPRINLFWYFGFSISIFPFNNRSLAYSTLPCFLNLFLSCCLGLLYNLRLKPVRLLLLKSHSYPCIL